MVPLLLRSTLLTPVFMAYLNSVYCLLSLPKYTQALGILASCDLHGSVRLSAFGLCPLVALDNSVLEASERKPPESTAAPTKVCVCFDDAAVKSIQADLKALCVCMCVCVWVCVCVCVFM